MAEPYLPEELLQLVLLHPAVPDNDEERVPIGRALAACCLVSKQIYRLAKPILYRSIYVQDTYVNTVKLLVRTMTYEPAIADHVRELYLGDNLFDDQDSDGDDLDGSMVGIESLESYEEVVNAATFLDEEIREQLIDGLSQGDPNKYIAMLFIICRRLELLDVVLSGSWDDDSVGEIMEVTSDVAAGKSEHREAMPLSQLRELRVRPGEGKGSIFVETIDDWLHNGQLEVFRAHKVDIVDAFYLRGKIDTIKHIHLTHSFCDNALVDFYFILPSLETFEIQVRPESEISFRVISEAMVEHGKNLKHVYIDTSSHGDPRYEGGGMHISFPLSDMHELRELQSLKVSAVAVYGRDDEDDAGYPNFETAVLTQILPTSLRMLELFDCAPEMEQAMRKQLDTLQADERFERLQSVRLRLKMDPVDFTN